MLLSLLAAVTVELMPLFRSIDLDGVVGHSSIAAVIVRLFCAVKRLARVVG